MQDNETISNIKKSPDLIFWKLVILLKWSEDSSSAQYFSDKLTKIYKDSSKISDRQKQNKLKKGLLYLDVL